jgi:hypothetical protein
VKAEHLDTVDQRDIVRKIGKFATALMQPLEQCVKAALEFSKALGPHKRKQLL